MNKNQVKIFIKNEDKTHDITSWKQQGSKFNITYSNNKTYSYNCENVKIIHSVLTDNNALNNFNYLKCLAEEVGIKEGDSNNILTRYYNKINFISSNNMLASFLTGKLNKASSKSYNSIYPFGFNLSQKSAIDIALNNQLSVIEGPPGTGKTQTILNIISNLVIQGKNVAVVSGNNSATSNILEKLKKNNLNFIAANLGNTENKKKFIEEQASLPNLLSWNLSTKEEDEIKTSLNNLSNLLDKMLLNRNELSKLQQELEAIELEHKHYNEYCNYTSDFISNYLAIKNSANSFKIWLLCKKYVELGKNPNFFIKFLNRIKYGIKNKNFYNLKPQEMINISQKSFYNLKIKELKNQISILKNSLKNFNFNAKLSQFTNLSIKIFHNELFKKYSNLKEGSFSLENLQNNSKKFINRYPVVLSTTYSLINSLNKDFKYDYVIIDEASQVDIVTGALALFCAKRAVIVGDLKQLSNVVDFKSAKSTDIIFNKFNVKEAYNYKNNSILSAILKLFPQTPKTLLKEHYRCHPKIIDFCNQKFYNNELIILTEPKDTRPPLILYKTVSGNHDRNHVNQRQIDVIKKEVIPQQNLMNCESVGIVTPYRNQTNELQKAFTQGNIQADTIDKFQGRENEVIILSTVDNKISNFTDDPNRLNVAVSRAINQLIIVNSDNESTGNIGDLINYIKYNNLEIIKSEVHSIFDYLYKGYNNQRKELLNKQKKISKYDSENLMYMLINNVLKEEQFSKLDFVCHIPLKMIIRNTTLLNEDEKKYADNILTHIDFVIFEKISKTPNLAIEVDGLSFHVEGTLQYERDKLKNSILEKYKLPLIRFKTNGSNEKEQLINKLKEIISIF